MALKSDGTVWSWGSDALVGNLGDGSPIQSAPLTPVLQPRPVQVQLPVKAVAIAGSREHSLALGVDGVVWAWGSNRYGELGIGRTGIGESVPQRVVGLTSVVSIGANDGVSWAVTRDRTLWAWGRNSGGELGRGNRSDYETTAAEASIVSSISAVGIDADGFALSATFSGFGAWGTAFVDGIGLSPTLTTLVPSLSSSIAFATDAGIYFALRRDGSVLSWGSNGFGQLGDGSGESNRGTPAPVSNLSLGKKHPFGNDLTIDFGAGIGIWQRRNNSSWTPLHGTPARHMVSADVDFNGRDDLVVDFGPQYGIWMRMNDATWVGLHGTSAREIVRADLDGNGQDDIVIDFGPPYGVWARMNNTSWLQLHGTSARHLTAADLDGDGRDDLVVDFGPQYGIWVRMNHRDWVALHGASAESITAADMDGNGMADLVIDFGTGHGIWTRMNNAEWVGLHGTSTSRAELGGATYPHIVAADMDGNGQDDVVVDFGPQYGIWVRMNNATWEGLHGTSARTMTAADLDGNGKADVVIDFGTANGGIWARMNGANWSQLNGIEASVMSSGQMDGN